MRPKTNVAQFLADHYDEAKINKIQAIDIYFVDDFGHYNVHKIHPRNATSFSEFDYTYRAWTITLHLSTGQMETINFPDLPFSTDD